VINRDTFFDMVRANPFPGSLTQQQVDGLNAILDHWEDTYEGSYETSDLRWLANLLAQTKWETSSTMAAIAEYGKGGSADYAKPDPTTGQCFYGRGLIQLTWASNYQRADKEMGWTKEAGTSCYWKADLQLQLDHAVPTAFRGMYEGWFRTSGGTPNNCAKYFNQNRDDPYEAREIVNGDKTKVPSWSGGVSIGNYIAGDHRSFLAALRAAYVPDDVVPEPEPEEKVVSVIISAPEGVRIEVQVINGDTNGEAVG
jgi:putative chitinase